MALDNQKLNVRHAVDSPASLDMASSTANYKQLKEDFVSNLSGGTVSEIAQVTLVAPVCHVSPE